MFGANPCDPRWLLPSSWLCRRSSHMHRIVADQMQTYAHLDQLVTNQQACDFSSAGSGVSLAVDSSCQTETVSCTNWLKLALSRSTQKIVPEAHRCSAGSTYHPDPCISTNNSRYTDPIALCTVRRAAAAEHADC